MLGDELHCVRIIGSARALPWSCSLQVRELASTRHTPELRTRDRLKSFDMMTSRSDWCQAAQASAWPGAVARKADIGPKSA